MLAGSRDVILLQQYLIESVFLLHMKNKEKWIASMGRQWPPPPSSVTRCIRNDSILSLMLLQERGSISVLCFLLWSYFSPPHSSVNVSTPSVISQSIWPRNIIVTSCWGSTLNIWGITRPVFRLKIVVLVYIDFFCDVIINAILKV